MVQSTKFIQMTAEVPEGLTIIGSEIALAQQRFHTRLHASLEDFQVNESDNHKELILHIANYWDTALAGSANVVLTAASGFLEQTGVMHRDLLDVIVLSAASHYSQTRKRTQEPGFLAHQHNDIALPVFHFFNKHTSLGINPHLAAALAYLHDIREDWAKHFIAMYYPGYNATYALTPDLKLSMISDEFQVANSFIKFFLENSWQENEYLRLLVSNNDRRLDSLELLTISPATKALMSSRQDIEVTEEWLRKIPQMGILEAIIKLFDLLSNTDNYPQRPEKSAQRFNLYYRLSSKLEQQLSSHPAALNQIRTIFSNVLSRLWDKEDCDLHQATVWERIHTLMQIIDSTKRQSERTLYEEELNFLNRSLIYLARLRNRYSLDRTTSFNYNHIN